MPADFLSDAERGRYQAIPADLSPEDLNQYCFLSPTDHALIAGQRRDHNRLGFALQLIIIRLMNHLPQQWYKQVPDSLASYVAGQLALDSTVLTRYGQREATCSEHLHIVLLYLKRRRWQPLIDIIPLEHWLLERALEHDNERVLLAMACEWLREAGILRPALIELERLVASLAELAHRETYRRLAPLLTDSLKATLDNLLIVDNALKLTPHTWLIQPPVSPTVGQIRLALSKHQYVTTLGVEDWKELGTHPNRQKRLAAIARSKTNQALCRLADEKRYPMLLAFCLEAYVTLTDYVLRLFDEYGEDIVGQANRELTEHQLKQVNAKDGILITLGKVAEPIVDELNVAGEALREQIYARVSRRELVEAIDLMLSLTGQGSRSFHHFLATRYRSIKSFSATMLDRFTFIHGFVGDDFDQALTLVGEWQTGRRRKVPDELPTKFLLPSWKSFVQPTGEPVDRTAYELSVLSRLRDRLRSGDVYVDYSRKYASPDVYLMP